MNSLKINNWTRKIQRSDFGDLKEHPPETWERSEKPPRINETRVVCLPIGALEKQFWGIFEPALSFFNGWEEHPEELDLHRIYKVELVEVLFATKDEQWVKIKILYTSKLCEVDFVEPGSSFDVFINNFVPHYYFSHENCRILFFTVTARNRFIKNCWLNISP